MTKYVLVPYIVRVHVKGKPNESRELDDLDGAGMDLAEELAALLERHAGNGRYRQSNTKKTRPFELEVVEVGKADRWVNMVLAPGRSGVESTIHQATGGVLARGFDDTEMIPLRHVLFYRAGSHRAILLAERVGYDGAVSALTSLLQSTWNAFHDDMRITIEPAMEEHAWQASLAKRPVIGYKLSQTDTKNGALALSEEPAFATIEIRPPVKSKRWGMKKLIQRAEETKEPLRNVILEELAPVLAPGQQMPDGGSAAFVQDGWTVAVELELDGGKRTTVNVEADASVRLSFAIIENVDEPVSRPTNADVVAAAGRLVGGGVFDTWGIGVDIAKGLQWSGSACENAKTKWKVVWTVVEPSANASSSGPLEG